MNGNVQQLVMLCHKMDKEGKTPSVGMLRSKAPFKASVTEAIEAIKRFNMSQKDASSLGSSATKVSGLASESLEQRVEALEKEVAALKRALNDVLQAQSQ